MRMSRRQGLLGGIKLPTFAELFATKTAMFVSGRNNSTQGTISVDFSTKQPSVGETWYVFYSVGRVMEAARVDYTNASALTKTKLFRITAGETYSSGFSVNGTVLSGNEAVYSGVFACIKFDDTYSSATIDEMFANCSRSYLQWYYESTPSKTTTDSETARSEYGITESNGVIIAMFYGAKANISVSPCVTPMSAIIGMSGDTPLNRTALVEKERFGINIYPTEDGTNIASVRSYILLRLSEKW